MPPAIPPIELPPSTGGEPAVKPVHSLPSYDEPMPETPRRISREEEAEQALPNTVFAPGARSLLIGLFLLTILSVPAIQLVVEFKQAGSLAHPRIFQVFNLIPSGRKIASARSLGDLNKLLPRPGEIKAVEKGIENESAVSLWLLPRVQSLLVGTLHTGNEQVILGRPGWLFYRPDVEYITGPPFLDPAQLKKRARVADVQPDPLKGIVDFRDRLAKRGIELILMPVPTKAGIDGEMLADGATRAGTLQNPSFAEFKARLKSAGVKLFDPEPLLAARKGSGALYLDTDTHWRPETMEYIAGRLAAFLGASRPAAGGTLRIVEKEVEAAGDLAAMLKLPAKSSIYQPLRVVTRQVVAGNSLWRQNKDADILLMGDSFCNIFSLAGMGWGESSGFSEHLSRALGRPLDCILRNSDASFATREILGRELARGRDRLAGKKQVVWEFAERELSFGNWKPVGMALGLPKPAHFFAPKPGECIEVTGIVESLSLAPNPGSVPYKDHIVTVHLVDVAGLAASAKDAPVEALAYLWSMRENVWTRAARLRPGDQIAVRLRPWADVSARYEQFNRSELADSALQLEEPAWGELLP